MKDNYTCPLDGNPLISDYDDESFSYICPSCNTLYLVPQGRENIDTRKEIESQALFKLEEYRKRLDEIRKEEENIMNIIWFTEGSGLIRKLNKANLSANEAKVLDINSKRYKEAEEKYKHLSDHLFKNKCQEEKPNNSENSA